MTDPVQNPAQPQLLPPAVPVALYPSPPRGRGFLSALLIFCGVFAVLGAICALGCFGIFSFMGYSGDSSLQVVHHSGNRNSPDKTAIVTLDGVIADSQAKFVERQFKTARDDAAVKAVVLKVDSPGGTISASDEIHRIVKKFRNDTGKPVIVSMQSLAASGGYYISMPANRIFAQPTTITGSIGVIATFPNVRGLMEKFGVDVKIVKTGPLKDSGSPLRAMSAQEEARWQEIINDAFERFLSVVVEGRKGNGLDRDKVVALATGGVYTANESLKNGLIDQIGYLDEAIAYAESQAGVSDTNVIEYKRLFSFSELLLGESSSARRPGIAGDLDGILRLNVPQVMYLSQAPTFGLPASTER